MSFVLNLDTLLKTAESAAHIAGELAREKWSQPRQTSHKGFRDLVTDADVACQQVITEMIRARFPDHGFLTEEEDNNLPATGPVLWVIDPIDGTTNYSRQNPLFCVSVAAVVPVSSDSTFEVLAGAVYDPMRDELFSAMKGGGVWLNKRPISVSSTHTLSEAVAAMDWSHDGNIRLRGVEMFTRFANEVFTLRAIGSAALAMAWIAAGRLDCYLNLNLSPWDFAAASLMLQEAGGQVTGLEGVPLGWQTKGNACVASNGRIHQDFLHTLIL